MKPLPLILILFSFVFFSFTTYGQEIIFKGLVEKPDGKLMDNVVLSKKYKNKPEEISSIFSGKFSIAISDTSALENISFSYLGYETVTLKAKDVLFFIYNNKNTDFLVVMKLKSIDLSQVVVTDKHPFYQNENASVFDYEIMPNGNLLLVMEKLIFLVSPQDSIIKTVPNTMGIDEIIKACSGRIFLRSKKFLYPTYINDTILLVSKDPVEINSSLEQINELIVCDTTIKIKEIVSGHNQKVIYKLQPVSDPTAEINLYVAQNKAQMKAANAQKARIDKNAELGKTGDAPTMMTASFESSVGATSFYDEMASQVWVADQAVWKYEFFTSKKIYTPIFLHHDSIYIFDHVINKVVVIAYNKAGNVLKLNTILKDSITYNTKKGWRKIILQDSHTGEFFTVYRNERLVLNNILLFGNKKQTNITLPKGHLFINKLKVYNHTAYYLWSDVTNETSTKRLYKVTSD